jgi:hypothetical protein
MRKIHIDTVQSEYVRNESSLQTSTRTTDEMEANINIIPNAIMIGDCSNNCIVYLEPQSICAFDSVIQTSRTTIYEGNTNDTSCEVNGVILENRIENIIEELYRDDSSVHNRKNICMIIVIVLIILGLFIVGFYMVLHK